MASTLNDFVLNEGTLAGPSQNEGINEEAIKQPRAFTEAFGGGPSGCNGTKEDSPSAVAEHSDLLSEELMKVCKERDLPIALKNRAHRSQRGKSEITASWRLGRGIR